MSRSGNDRAEQARRAYAEHQKATSAAHNDDLEAQQNTEQALSLRWDLEVRLADWADRMGIAVYDLETTFSSTVHIGDINVPGPHAFASFRGVYGACDWDMMAEYEAGYDICVKLKRAHERMVVDETSIDEFLDNVRIRWPDMLLPRKKREKLARKR